MGFSQPVVQLEGDISGAGPQQWTLQAHGCPQWTGGFLAPCYDGYDANTTPLPHLGIWMPVGCDLLGWDLSFPNSPIKPK